MPAPSGGGGGGETTANGSNPSDGSDPSKNMDQHHHHRHEQENAPRDFRVLPNLMSNCPPITLKFIDLTYNIVIGNNSSSHKGGGGSGPAATSTMIRRCVEGHVDHPQPSDHHRQRTILHGITGMAHPGEILAVLGPSGSGKSTLLNALAGRLHGCSGTILANNRRFDRSVQRRTGFVPQDDVLFPHLTVRETLVYCALLRLPEGLPRAEKVAAAEAVMVELGLERCADTAVGSGFVRGVSGGERKRVSVGHELLVNPSLLVLDEPTSGLDATAAQRLVGTLGAVAVQRGKTVVASVHQPSSRVYQMFDAVLVLSEGRCVYFGRGRDALSYFESIGYSPSFPMNPADFLLDLANGVVQQDRQSERDHNNNKTNTKQNIVTSYNTLLAPKIKSLCVETSNNTRDHSSLIATKLHHHSPRPRSNNARRWLGHFSVLLRRSLKERRHEAFNSLRVFQVVAAAILSGLMWWHSEYLNVQDRLGLLFFVSIFWGVLPSFNAVFAFPQERAILLKEQASGMYSLSSYFMARIIGDAPVELVLPTAFLAIAYWMAGLSPDIASFFLTLVVLLSYVLVSQGLGLALGAAIMDAKQASTLVTITMLAFVLTGGFYVHKVPFCLGWIKYVSTTFYAYRLLINVQYGDGEAISAMLGCFDDQHHRHGYDHGREMNDRFRANCKFIEEDVAGQISPLVSVGVLVLMFLGYRVLAYLALRRVKP